MPIRRGHLKAHRWKNFWRQVLFRNVLATVFFGVFGSASIMSWLSSAKSSRFLIGCLWENPATCKWGLRRSWGCGRLDTGPRGLVLVHTLGSFMPFLFQGFPGGWDGKQSCNAGDLGSISGLGRSPGKRKGYPLQYSVLENSMDCIVHGDTKSWTWLSDCH